MRERLACLLACGLLTIARAEPPRVDAAGDPLPPGAVMRLGTLEHLQSHSRSAWTRLDDQKTALVARGDTVHWLDAGTGRTTGTWRVPVGHRILCFSRDGRLAVLVHDYQPFL